MPLINCKIKLNLTWKKECVLSTDAGNAVFIINDTKMYVPVVTLSKEDNKDFIEQQNKGVQRSIYWNEYNKTKEINENADANVFKYINLDPSFQGVNRLFATAYSRVDGQPRANIFRIQAYDSIMCGYFCIEFINYMFKGKTLLDYTNLFSPNDFKKNDQVIKRIFKNE